MHISLTSSYDQFKVKSLGHKSFKSVCPKFTLATSCVDSIKQVLTLYNRLPKTLLLSESGLTTVDEWFKLLRDTLIKSISRLISL